MSKNLEDECDCGFDTFPCHDGSGCVALGEVCDRLFDCTDGSDECIYQSYLSCTHEMMLTGHMQAEQMCRLWNEVPCKCNSTSKSFVMRSHEKVVNCSEGCDFHCNRTTKLITN